MGLIAVNRGKAPLGIQQSVAPLVATPLVPSIAPVTSVENTAAPRAVPVTRIPPTEGVTAAEPPRTGGASVVPYNPVNQAKIERYQSALTELQSLPVLKYGVDLAAQRWFVGGKWVGLEDYLRASGVSQNTIDVAKELNMGVGPNNTVNWSEALYRINELSGRSGGRPSGYGPGYTTTPEGRPLPGQEQPIQTTGGVMNFADWSRITGIQNQGVYQDA